MWKITDPGTSGAAPGSGASGTIGSRSGGVEGMSWDLLAMTTLDVSNADSRAAFTISPVGTLSSSPYATYSWVIATASGVVTPPSGTTNGQNLLTAVESGGDAFALDTSGLSDGGVQPSASQFSLEFEDFSGSTDLVLDYTAAPEPGVTALCVSGILPMLMRRRRRIKGVSPKCLSAESN